MARRSIGAPLTIGIILGLLLLSLAVGWQVLVWTDLRPAQAAAGLSTLDWVLLVLGTIFFVVVLVGLVWMCAWLVREMRINQSQRAFLDAVTHEMRTPLASFRLYLETLERHDPEEGRRREFLARMSEDLDRLDHTVEQVLAAARADERGRTPLSARVEVTQLLARCIDDVIERHALPREAVEFEGGAGAVPVRGDAGELGIVFKNLLENAIKYSEDPVDVRVGVAATGDGRVRVEIRDSGIGIPPSELRKVFRRFYRASRDVQRKVSGLGLGLFIVRSLVRRQGGQIQAVSEGHGRGSRFVVTLRAAPSAG